MVKKLWSIPGVDASNALAAEDAERMRTFKDSIRSAAQETGIDAAVIAAIISRETRAGNYLGSNGWNSSQVAFGIMQVGRSLIYLFIHIYGHLFHQ